jgi:hypothetical protein
MPRAAPAPRQRAQNLIKPENGSKPPTVFPGIQGSQHVLGYPLNPLRAGSNRLFELLHSYWYSPKSGDMSDKSRQFKQTSFFRVRVHAARRSCAPPECGDP